MCTPLIIVGRLGSSGMESMHVLGHLPAVVPRFAHVIRGIYYNTVAL